MTRSTASLGGQPEGLAGLETDERARRLDRRLGRVARDCPHNVPHRHRTRSAYVKDRCRCNPCTAANRRAEAERARALAYGCWQPYVDAAAARRHVKELRTAGLGLRRIAAVSGVSYGSLAALLYRDWGAGRTPSRRIRPSTEAALLSITPSADNMAPGSLLDAVGTRRRLQALVTVGWPPARLAHLLGRRRDSVGRLLQARTVTGGTAREVRALFDRIWSAPPPEPTERDRAAVHQARALAARHGWRSALAWDDIDTDPDPVDGELTGASPRQGRRTTRNCAKRPGCGVKPTNSGAPATRNHAMSDYHLDEVAVERAMNGDPVALTKAERAEVVRRLTARGLPVRQIAERLHTTSRTITRVRARMRTA